jgi:Cdc6-like AAA superfamily ATPase
MEGSIGSAERSAPSDEQVVRLLPLLAEAARATAATAARFVSPRPGILEEASARRHQLVYGRRGVGKSTLLRRVAADGSGTDREVIFIDVETLRRRPYPDVLIELLTRLLSDLEERLRRDGLITRLKRRRLLRRVRALSHVMESLLREPQTAEHTVKRLRSQSQQTAKGLGASARVRALLPHHGGAVTGGAGGSISKHSESGSESESESEARFQRTKMDGLSEAAILISNVLGDAHQDLGVPTLVVLDDFYHIRLADQPEVLAYLHQVVKELDIHLKICGVRHRLNTFEDGDPPVGMEPEHDADQITLDVTLERFAAAKDFLEKVLAGICAEVGVEVDALITDGGRERLVLASGGVARDYLSVVRRALRNSTERPAHQFRPKNRITAEDVAEAASDLYEQKQEELKEDAGEEAEALRSRLSDVVNFAVEKNRTNVLLVETTKLQEVDWGKEVQGLVDLRFLHKVDTLSTKRGGETYAGRKFAAFSLDLSTWTSTRSEQISPISFWEQGGKQKMRQPRLIYTPERAESERANAREAEPILAEGEQLTFDTHGVAEE